LGSRKSAARGYAREEAKGDDESDDDDEDDEGVLRALSFS